MIPLDKALHAIGGALIALGVYAALLVLQVPHAAEYSLLAAVLVGIAKEASDRWANIKAARAGLPPPHGVELLDALATAAGGGVVFLAAKLSALAV